MDRKKPHGDAAGAEVKVNTGQFKKVYGYKVGRCADLQIRKVILGTSKIEDCFCSQ